MRAWIVMVLAACGGPAAPPPAAPAPPAPVTSNRAEAEPWTPPPAKPKQLVVRGPLGAMQREIRVEDELPVRMVGRLEDLSSKRSDLWHPCVRDVVQGRERTVRDLLGDALTAYLVTCDRVAGTVTFGSSDRRTAAKGSYLGISGVVTATTARLELAVVRHGEVLPERITILAGTTRWTSIGLDPVYDPVAERSVATVPFTRSLARVIRTVLDADEAILRFESTAGSEDVVITENMKQDLRVLAELGDALNP
jgi:hypothetical protein